MSGRADRLPALLAALIGATLVVPAVALAASPASHHRAHAASACDSPETEPAAGSAGRHLSYRGRSRFFQLHVPPAIATGDALPLVLVLHGAGGNGRQMERYSGFSSVADAHGFVVAYPNAAAPLWNVGENPRRADDAGFLRALIATVEDEVCVDGSRVYATGVSNGAGMAALLGCRAPGTIAAIAPVEGVYETRTSCRIPRPVSVLEIHGTADRIAPYYGLDAASTASGVPPFVRSWIHRDGCATTARTRRLAARTTVYGWTRCARGAVVEHIRVEGGGHQWPGAAPPDPGPPTTFCAACQIWGFFAGLPGAGSRSGGASLAADR